ncbi:phage major capsid protein [Clostridium paraputrificum]|uniref:phage major capsid protein n=1 Tax=Clostridium paraputrificum TaxID=29363 RepID=UPI000666D1A2|nr:phage major capsid protein [Clostridium paraputrificum]MDB2105967.1 phage major capsid protein [Clostridium paraputrificum]MDB2114311.1 phage major capsid protein [Clostridium paraputrificum]
MKHLIEKRNDSLARIEEILALVEAEQRPMTEEEMAEIEALKTEVEEINKQKEVVESTRNLKPVKEKEENKKDEVKEVMERNLEVRAQEERAFENAIRNGEIRNLQAGDNGSLIPETVSERIVAKVKELSPLLAECQIVNVKGNYRVIKEASATEANYVEEGSTFTGADSTFEAVVLKSHVIGALVKVSNSLINNTELDIVGYVVDRLARAIAEKLEKEILVGTTGKITGISTTRNIVNCAGDDIAIDDLIDLQNAVYARPEETMFIVSRETFGKIRKMKDAVGQPYLCADASRGFANTLFGARVVVSDMLTGGDALAYLVDPKAVVVKFAKEVEVKVLNEKYAEYYATGVVGYVEADATIENDQKCAVLKAKSLMRARK